MKKKSFSVFFVFCSLLSFENVNNGLLASCNENVTVMIKKCSDFKVTGDGLAEQWKNADWISLAVQDKSVSSYQTKVKTLYSEKGIYFLFNCEDKKLTSTMKADNLNLWEEDVVEVFLWTDENFPVYFEYELSPFNYELPLMVPNNKGNFLGWLPWHYEGERKIQHATSVSGGKLESGGAITSWIAEFFIPYKLLVPLSNVPPKPGTRWRANMYRIDYDNGEVPFAWQKTTTTFHEYNKFGTFLFE
jgi:hypothetical protein